MTILAPPYAIVPGRRSSTSRFYFGDCLDLFAQLPPGSIDVIVTSPPYNLGIRYNEYRDTLTAAEYLEWTGRWVAAAARVLHPQGSLFLNVGTRPSDPWTALDVAQAARAAADMTVEPRRERSPALKCSSLLSSVSSSHISSTLDYGFSPPLGAEPA